MNRKVYRIAKAGSIRDLQLQTDLLPEPEVNQVQINVKAIGLNFADIFALTGLYSATPSGPFIPGLEYAGEITKIGNGIRDYRIGDQVMGMIRFGAYTDYLNADVDFIFPLPKEWTFSEGAAYLVNTLTAYYALVSLGSLRKNQKVLIHSAAGGVGIMANRIAKKMGAVTVGTIGDSSKNEICRRENYDAVFIRDKDLYKKIELFAASEGLDLVLEAIGGKVFSESYRLLAPQGRLITFGAAGFAPAKDKPNWLKIIYYYLSRPKIDPLKMISDNKSVMGFNLIWLWEKVAEMRDNVKELISLNIGPPVVGTSFSFEDLPLAVRSLQSGKTIGKVIIDLEKPA